MSPSSRPLHPGTLVAPGYEVVAHLSRGRSLDVYDVWSEERESRCVAKTLRPERRQDVGARRRLLREGRLLCRLSHPHIVRGYELLAGPAPVVIMETLTGETLAHLLARRSRRLAAADIEQLGLQLASALGYLHRQGMLHLDLKPSNIVAEAGRVKLIDLSIARAPGWARPGLGTWCYLAPEQARGGCLTEATDVWGLGMVLYEAAAGRPLVDEDDQRDYPQAEDPIPPIGHARRLPRSLAQALDACLAPAPADRPSLATLRVALESAAGGRSGSGSAGRDLIASARQLDAPPSLGSFSSR
jgi:serine/threonine protein kinase